MFVSAFDISKPSRVQIAGVPSGHEARVLAEIALRVHGQPVIHVALDDVRAAMLAESLAFFAPHVEVINFPAWDCLPYDRISPHADILGQRVNALARLMEPFKSPAVVLTTVNAIGQKTLPPEILQRSSLGVSVGDELSVDNLSRFLATNGYVRSGTVRESGEFAIRGGIVDLFPTGYESPVRLDFLGDEIEAIREFDPLTQTTTGKLDALRLRPISEVLLDERSMAHFRSGYRELFGAVTESDPLYEAVSAGNKFPGVEHWLGLFYPRLSGILEYLPTSPVTFDWQSEEALKSRWQQIEDFYQARLSLYQASKRAK
ncbi:MAG: transcription-repair coupling factor, partial [Alphaproteobacteria bacterium]|nr:transcription-repair coupling factor [Alphaproteobacteria bacterium]